MEKHNNRTVVATMPRPAPVPWSEFAVERRDPAAAAAARALDKKRAALGYTSPCERAPAWWDIDIDGEPAQAAAEHALMAIQGCFDCAVLLECCALRDADESLRGVLGARIVGKGEHARRVRSKARAIVRKAQQRQPAWAPREVSA